MGFAINIKYKYIIFFLFVLLCFATNQVLEAKVKCDSIFSGNVGDEIQIPFAMDNISTGDTIEFDIIIENPTVFYFDSICSNNIDFEYNYSIDDFTDVHIKIAVNSLLSDSSNFILHGELLAANTDSTYLYFRNVKINNEPIEDSQTLITSASNLPTSYIRLVSISVGYPNPIRRNETIHWKYSIDKEMPIRIGIYNNAGTRLYLEEILIKEPGIFDFEWTPEVNVSSGIYYILIQTSFGAKGKRFIIMN